MPAERLTEYLQRRAGDFLRGVVEYDADSYEIYYLRDDLDQDTFRQRVEHAHDGIIQHPSRETGEESFGEAYATLSVREYAVVLNLRWTPTDGMLVGLEPEAASDLVDFIHESLEHGRPEDPAENRESE